MTSDSREEFIAFFDASERRLRQALTGAFGVESGRDASAEALAWAWQNWASVREMANPIGYLFQVGRTSALRSLGGDETLGQAQVEVHPSSWELPAFEPNLAKFIASLTEQQRVAVWLVHGLGFSHKEAAELLNCTRPTVATHVRRGLAKLRHELGLATIFRLAG